MVQNPSVSSPAGTLDLYTASSAWTEASVTWATQPAGTPVASAATTGATSAVSTFGFGASPLASIAPIAAMVTGTNNGFMIDKQSGVVGNLVTREYSTSSQRPKLTICYTPAPPAGCTDGIKNGLETDVDCGGGACAPCAIGGTCSTADDCTSSACGSSSTCIATPTGPTPSFAPLVTGIVVQYGPTTVETLTYYQSPLAAPPGGRPVAYVVPGGGFTGLPGGGRNAPALTQFAQVQNAIGVDVIAADYVLTASGGVNPYPAAINDMRLLSCWGQANAATYGFNMSQAGWFGFSAGANLVGMFSTTLGFATLPSGKPLATPTCTLTGSVKFWSAYYGNVGMVPSEWSASNPHELYSLNVPSFADPLFPTNAADVTVVCHPGDPPVYLVDGRSDTVVLPAAIRRTAAQCRTVVPVLDIAITGGIHGFGPEQWGPAIYQPATNATNAWVAWLASGSPLPPL